MFDKYYKVPCISIAKIKEKFESSYLLSFLGFEIDFKQPFSTMKKSIKNE